MDIFPFPLPNSHHHTPIPFHPLRPRQNRLNRLTRVHLMHRLTKLLRRHQLHQLVNRKPALPIPLNHLGHKLRRVRPSLNSPNPLLPSNHELKADNAAERVIEGRRADLDVFPAVAHELHARVHQDGSAGGVDDDVGADAVGDFLDYVFECFALAEIGAVDYVGGSELFGELHARFDFVDADDLSAAHDFRTHNGGETHTSQAHNADGVFRACARDVDDCAAAGLNSAAEGCEELEVFLVVYDSFRVDDGALLDDAEVGKGGLAEEEAADFWLAGLGGEVEGWGGAEVELVEGVAVGLVACFADFAVLAEGEGAEDWVAGGGYCDAWTDLFHVPGACEVA